MGLVYRYKNSFISELSCWKVVQRQDSACLTAAPVCALRYSPLLVLCSRLPSIAQNEKQQLQCWLHTTHNIVN